MKKRKDYNLSSSSDSLGKIPLRISHFFKNKSFLSISIGFFYFFIQSYTTTANPINIPRINWPRLHQSKDIFWQKKYFLR